MKKIVVLGGNGMLGGAVLRSLVSNRIPANVSFRGSFNGPIGPGIKPFEFDALNSATAQLDRLLADGDILINCIGVTNKQIRPLGSLSQAQVRRVNTSLPRELAQLSLRNNFRVIQIATDCVFSGRRGQYLESDPHDSTDIYGQSKSEGEALSKNMMHVRCSIVGPQFGRKDSLFEWFRNQPVRATVNGFTNHFWNGVTVDAFAKLATGIVTSGFFFAGVGHFVPMDAVTKHALLGYWAKKANRPDVKLVPFASGTSIDRTLSTEDRFRNREFWNLAGYKAVPRIESLVEEMASTHFFSELSRGRA